MFESVIQEETPGCEIAAVANIRQDFDVIQPKWFNEVKNL